MMHVRSPWCLMHVHVHAHAHAHVRVHFMCIMCMASHTCSESGFARKASCRMARAASTSPASHCSLAPISQSASAYLRLCGLWRTTISNPFDNFDTRDHQTPTRDTRQSPDSRRGFCQSRTPPPSHAPPIQHQQPRRDSVHTLSSTTVFCDHSLPPLERVIGRDALTRSVPYCLFRGTAERKISEVGTTCIVRNQGANTPQSMLSTHVKPLKLA